MNLDRTYNLDIVQWEGRIHCVYLNDHRVVGEKPWGGGNVVKTFEGITLRELSRAIPELRAVLGLNYLGNPVASVTADPRVQELEAENAKMAGLLVTVLNGYRHGQIKGGTLINRAAGTMKSVEQTILDTMGWKLVDETPAKDDRQGSLVLVGNAGQTATEPQEAV